MSGDERTPEAIRRDIEHTREQVAETAAALAEKADVKARAHDKVEETKARITGKVDEAKSKVAGTAGTAKEKVADATPASVASGAQSAAGTAQVRARENPIPVAVVAGFAAGVLLGWLIASRRS
ncbi:MAG: DUF3618 domain-containing protein [Solirubrobacterales bacterium]|nr:DUF3618 domain-containing protein [Solirubrobacterales bacterium]